jgi:copper chaperone
MTTGQHTYTVVGMSCEHCALSVRAEVGGIAGVERVDVDLDFGRVDVVGSGFSDEEVQAAVTSAGYRLASPPRNGGSGGNAGD